MNEVEYYFAWRGATSMSLVSLEDSGLGKSSHVSEGVRRPRLAINHEILENLNGDPTFGLHELCSLGTILVGLLDEPDNLFSL